MVPMNGDFPETTAARELCLAAREATGTTKDDTRWNAPEVAASVKKRDIAAPLPNFILLSMVFLL